MSIPKFAIGQRFTTRGKNPRLCTVIDVLRTYNSRDHLVAVRYVATHEFMGQTIEDRDVCETTIAMGAVHGFISQGSIDPFQIKCDLCLKPSEAH